jgi:hypothetical protein
VEAELDMCKARLREVEAQLLEVLEEKLRLRQEVEAWEVGVGMTVGPGRHRRCPSAGPESAFLFPGGHAAACETKDPESTADRVPGRSECPWGPWCCQKPLGPISAWLAGAMVVRTGCKTVGKLSLFIKTSSLPASAFLCPLSTLLSPSVWEHRAGCRKRAQQLLGQEALDGSHEVLWAVSVDPVASIRHGLHLGPRKKSPNLRVVAGPVTADKHVEKTSKWDHGKRNRQRQSGDRCPMVLWGSPYPHPKLPPAQATQAGG